jgi:hypothetical protein
VISSIPSTDLFCGGTAHIGDTACSDVLVVAANGPNPPRLQDDKAMTTSEGEAGCQSFSLALAVII